VSNCKGALTFTSHTQRLGAIRGSLSCSEACDAAYVTCLAVASDTGGFVPLADVPNASAPSTACLAVIGFRPRGADTSAGGKSPPPGMVGVVIPGAWRSHFAVSVRAAAAPEPPPPWFEHPATATTAASIRTLRLMPDTTLAACPRFRDADRQFGRGIYVSPAVSQCAGE